jgi:hypothetical protein
MMRLEPGGLAANTPRQCLLEDSDGFYPGRTAIDNALSRSAVETLTELMQNFRRQHPE